MKEINQLCHQLRPHLNWHGARIRFLALFLVALFRSKTVNLTKLSTVFASQAEEASNYKRMKRFFKKFEVNQADIARLVVKLSQIPQPWTLSLDRTNWSFGAVHFNILMLGVVHEGIAFPLFWTLLDKRGNSNTDERIDLIERFQQLFPQVKVHCLTADREFIGQEWSSYLLISPQMPFRIRIRYSDYISSQSGKTRAKGIDTFLALQPGEVKCLARKRWVWGRKVYVVGSRLADNRLLILVTNTQPETALKDYAQRWGIETLFGALKTRGFNLESTHFRHGAKLDKLIALLAIAFTWAMKMGLWLHAQKPIPRLTHGRRAKSLFRLGLDFLQRTVTDFSLRKKEFSLALNLLSPY